MAISIVFGDMIISGDDSLDNLPLTGKWLRICCDQSYPCRLSASVR